jgi:transposase-like protein
MTPTAEALEAVILSGPRRGEIVTFPAGNPEQPNPKEVEALNRVLDELNEALSNVSTELRAALRSLKPKSKEA